LPKDPREIFAAAAKSYDFSDASLKPWHLKASYQLYKQNGKPTAQGTYEYWWASPKTYRSTWMRGGVRKCDGESFVGQSGKGQPDLVGPFPCKSSKYQALSDAARADTPLSSAARASA
jgi:hypothetical protein